MDKAADKFDILVSNFKDIIHHFLVYKTKKLAEGAFHIWYKLVQVQRTSLVR